MIAGHLEKGPDELLGFSQPFGDQIRRRHGEEGGVVSLGRHCLGQVRFTCE